MRHANQLINPNTCKGFLSLQNGLSVWFTRLHNHGEDCWSDSCPEDNHWTPFTRRVSHKHSLPKKAVCSQSAVSKHVNRKLSGRKKCGRKDAQPTERTASLMRIVKQNRFKNLGELHKDGLRLGQCIKSHHTQTCQGIWLQLSYSSC